jgi:hypothetical protein
MKRKIITLGLVGMMALSLCACGVPADAKCEICGAKATKALKVDGEKHYTCKTCYELASEIIDLYD